MSPNLYIANEKGMACSSGLFSKSFLHLLVKFWCLLFWYKTVAHEHISNKQCNMAGKANLKTNKYPNSHLTLAETLYPKRPN